MYLSKLSTKIFNPKNNAKIIQLNNDKFYCTFGNNLNDSYFAEEFFPEQNHQTKKHPYNSSNKMDILKEKWANTHFLLNDASKNVILNNLSTNFDVAKLQLQIADKLLVRKDFVPFKIENFFSNIPNDEDLAKKELYLAQKILKNKDVNFYYVIEFLPELYDILENKQSLSELSLIERRKLLAEMFNVTKEDRLLEHVPKNIKEVMPLFPANINEYLNFIPELQKSLGINIIPFSKKQIKLFANILRNFYDLNNDFRNIDFDKTKINLKFSREDFIKEVYAKVKNLSPSERNIVTDYFGLHFDYDEKRGLQLYGYPVITADDKKLAVMQNPTLQNIILDLKPVVKKFVNENKVMVIGFPKFSQQLQELYNLFPELLTTVGKKQHGCHSYSVDVHTLKVIQNIIKDERFSTLSKKDKNVILISALFHDLTKAEGIKDKSHPYNSAFDTELILRKINLSTEKNNKIYALINSHEWYGDLCKMFAKYNNIEDLVLQKINLCIPKEIEKKIKEVAYELRIKNTFDLAKIFTRSDLKAVQCNDLFYEYYGQNLNKISNLIDKKIYQIQKNTIFLPQIKIFPKASELVSDGNIIKEVIYKGIKNKILFIDKILDHYKLKFISNGQKRFLDFDNFAVIVHALDNQESLATAATFVERSSKSLSSASYLYHKKGYNNSTFKPQGIIVNVCTNDIIAGENQDIASGYGKSKDDVFKYLFSDESVRSYFSSKIKNKFSFTNQNYIEFVNKYLNMSFEDIARSNFEDAEILRKLFTELLQNRKHSSKYNEILVSKFNKIQAVFYSGKTTQEIPEYLRKFAMDNNLPIIYFEK